MSEPMGAFYQITGTEMGWYNTGSRSANYHYYCIIYDAEGNEIKDHPLSDTFAGRWVKCSAVINKWRKQCERAKLKETTFKPQQ